MYVHSLKAHGWVLFSYSHGPHNWQPSRKCNAQAPCAKLAGQARRARPAIPPPPGAFLTPSTSYGTLSSAAESGCGMECSGAADTLQEEEKEESQKELNPPPEEQEEESPRKRVARKRKRQESTTIVRVQPPARRGIIIGQARRIEHVRTT